MIEPISKLKALNEDLKALELGEFLKSNNFHRMCVKLEIDEFWQSVYRDAKDARTFYSLGMDVEAYDSEQAIVIALNIIFQNHYKDFFSFFITLLTTYSDWKKEDLFIDDFREDLLLLGASAQVIKELEKLAYRFSQQVPKTIVPSDVWNYNKLEEVVRDMDKSITNERFNLTITYAYTCLEGIFKAYVQQHLPEHKSVDKLNSLSTLVRDHLKKRLNDENRAYPEQILNLIPTITNGVSNARNEFSESHFDNQSEKWLAEFCRDCVSSVARLILKFVD